MVMAAHLYLLDCGWIGVASLFVLSGFLITRVLFSDIESTPSLGPCLKRFYIRRSLRIFPVYYLYLVVLLVLMPFFGALYDQVHDQIGFAFVHVYNLFVLTKAHHYTHVLDHLWSMSVEEQFYLVWPLVVYFVGRKRLPWLCIAVILVAPVIRWATVAYWPPDGWSIQFISREKAFFAVYFSTASHIDAFAFGALLNYIRIKPRAWWVPFSLLVSYLIAVPVQGWGILPIGSPWVAPLSLGYPLSLPNGHQYVWGYSVVYFNMALLIYAISHAGWIQDFFSMKALDWLGQRAYPIYEVHYGILFAMEPLLRVMYHALGSWYLATFLFFPLWASVVFVVSHWIHEKIEKPAFRLKDRFSSSVRGPAAPASTPATEPATAQTPP